MIRRFWLFGVLTWLVATEALAVVPVTTPFLRGTDALNHMRVDPKGRFIAYINDNGLGLNVIDIKTKSIFRVSDAQVGASFFWSPDGFRLFYRELQTTKEKPDAVESVLRAYDCAINRNVTLENLPYATGFLTFDPRDLRMQIMSPNGIRTKRIYFPDERLARWQVAQRNEQGKWLATQGGMLWVTQGGYAMKKLDDDNSGIESFDIAPDGSAVAWATNGGRVYMMRSNKEPKLIGYGRDPKWHPEKPQLVYAGARTIGDKTVNYDLRVVDGDGHGKFLTATQFSNERWPHWHPSGKQILYTMANSTDVYLVDFAP